MVVVVVVRVVVDVEVRVDVDVRVVVVVRVVDERVDEEADDGPAVLGWTIVGAAVVGATMVGVTVPGSMPVLALGVGRTAVVAGPGAPDGPAGVPMLQPDAMSTVSATATAPMRVRFLTPPW